MEASVRFLRAIQMVTVTIVGVILVGLSSFWDRLVNWRANKITRQEAVNKITGRYREFVGTFEVARACRVKRIAGSVSGMSAGIGLSKTNQDY